MRPRIGMLYWVVLVIPLLVLSEKPSLAGEALDCVIEPNATIKIGSNEEGILAETLVERGDIVKKGEPLARLDSDVERLTAELAKLRSEDDTDIRSGQTQLDFRAREKDRIHELVQDQSVAMTDFDKSQVEADLAQLAVQSAEIKQRIAKVDYQRAEELYNRRTIRSPVNGIVVEVQMSPGEYVHKQAQLMTIAAVNPLHVEVFAPLADYGRITEGMSAKVLPEEPVGGAYEAKVIVVDKVFNAASRTFGVRLMLPNKQYRLPAGLHCKVEFSTDTTKADRAGSTAARQ